MRQQGHLMILQDPMVTFSPRDQQSTTSWAVRIRCHLGNSSISQQMMKEELLSSIQMEMRPSVLQGSSSHKECQPRRLSKGLLKSYSRPILKCHQQINIRSQISHRISITHSGQPLSKWEAPKSLNRQPLSRQEAPTFMRRKEIPKWQA